MFGKFFRFLLWIFALFYCPLVLAHGWEWFAVPAGMQSLPTYWHAFGLLQLVGWLSGSGTRLLSYNMIKELKRIATGEDETDGEKNFAAILSPLTAALIHLFMWLASKAL